MGKECCDQDDGPCEVTPRPVGSLRKELPRHLLALHLRETLPCKTKTVNEGTIEFFSGRKFIDAILASPYALSHAKPSSKAYITDRAHAIAEAQGMIDDELFFRAQFADVPTKRKDGTEKTKKVLVLDGDVEQVFVDEEEPFVWLFKHRSKWIVIMGIGLLVAVAACMLLPLWPESMRWGVHYLSQAALVLVGLIIGLEIVRLLLFLLVWICTLGHYHLWIMPLINDDSSGLWKSFTTFYSFTNVVEEMREKKEKEAKGKSKKGKGGDKKAAGETSAPTTATATASDSSNVDAAESKKDI